MKKGREDGKKLGISHLDKEMLHAPQISFIALLIEAADFNIRNPTKSTTFNVPSFYRFDNPLLHKLYNLHDEFSLFLKPRFLSFMNDTKMKVPGNRKSIEQLYSYNMQLFK